MSLTIVDTHGRPMPRFYDLPIETRAFVIQHERIHAYFRRSYLTPVERFKNVARSLAIGDTMHALDLYEGKEQKALYTRLLMGDGAVR